MADPIYEGMLSHIEKSVNEQEGGVHLAGKFGVFGYSKDDEATYVSHYDTEGEAKAAALKLAQNIGYEELVYVEVWQGDEQGQFGVSGEPIWKSDAPENEAKVNEEEIAEKKLVDMSDGELDKIFSHLEKVSRVGFNVESKMKEIMDEIEKRDKVKKESKE